MSTVPERTPTPEQFEGHPRRNLLDDLIEHESFLVAARQGIGGRRDPVVVRLAALIAIATARALAAVLLRWEWVAQVDALRHGATLADVAAASGLEVDEVLAGLRSRIAGQVEQKLMSRADADELLALIERAAAPD